MRLLQTPSQTVGPFFKPALIRSGQESLVTASTRGERVAIEGRVLDGDAAAVSDAMIELWQANADGCYDHPEDLQERVHRPRFSRFRSRRDRRARPLPLPDHQARSGCGARRPALQAPHINVSIFARGLLKRLVTRIYFPDEPLNASDAVLNAIAPARRSTLVAQVERPGVLRFDIVLQGEHETVFFDV